MEKLAGAERLMKLQENSGGAAPENGLTAALSLLERKNGKDSLLCSRTLPHPVSSQQHPSLVSTQLVSA